MNNKLLIIVSILTIIIISFVSAGLFGWGKDVSLAPSRALTIDAHQCSADRTCEMNNARILGNLVVNGNFTMDCEVFNIIGNNSGISTCVTRGYETCIAEEFEINKIYYDSINASCLGNIQVELNEFSLKTCSNTSAGGSSCLSIVNGAEPYTGDQERIFTTSKVICCK